MPSPISNRSIPTIQVAKPAVVTLKLTVSFILKGMPGIQLITPAADSTVESVNGTLDTKVESESISARPEINNITPNVMVSLAMISIIKGRSDVNSTILPLNLFRLLFSNLSTIRTTHSSPTNKVPFPYIIPDSNKQMLLSRR